MKSIIKNVQFDKDVETKFGLMYRFKVQWEDKTGSYLSAKKDQTDFVAGQEAEFNVTVKEYQGQNYYNVKPIRKSGNSNFSKRLQAEQSKYSGFAMSYAKDLRVHGKITGKQEMFNEAKEMFDWMVKMDKTLKNG